MVLLANYTFGRPWSRPRLGGTVTALVAIASLLITTAQAALDPIVIKGSKFFNNNTGEQFYIKGVSYQQSLGGIADANAFIDPLADASGCQRDVPYLQKLGVNVVRKHTHRVRVSDSVWNTFMYLGDLLTFLPKGVYAVTPDLNHDNCMNLFADAGIYVLSGLGGAGQSIDVSIQYADPEWTNTLYEVYALVVDALQGYTNTLGFFAGDELVNSSSTAAAAYVKAAARDMKSYISDKGYRTIGIGYSGSDDSTLLDAADYMACGDSSSAIDFFGINDFSWCGDSSITESGYSDLINDFGSYSIPIFLSEYGCNTPSPRTFSEVQAIYGSQMTPFLSGGVAYEYFEEDTNYGLVNVSGDSVSPLEDYSNLQSQLSNASPSAVQISAYTPTNSPPACPTNQGSSWSVTSVLPTPPSEAVAANSEASTAASATGGGTTSTSSANSSGNGSSKSGTSSSSGLSSGATIGIGVGVGVGAAIILGALIACFCIRRRRNAQAKSPGNPAMSQTGRAGVPEADSNPRAELEHSHSTRYHGAEMPAGRDPQEMPNEHYGPPKPGPAIDGRHELSASNDNPM